MPAYTVCDRINVMTSAVNVNITNQLNRSLVNILINHSPQHRKDVQDLCYTLSEILHLQLHDDDSHQRRSFLNANIHHQHLGSSIGTLWISPIATIFRLTEICRNHAGTTTFVIMYAHTIFVQELVQFTNILIGI